MRDFNTIMHAIGRIRILFIIALCVCVCVCVCVRVCVCVNDMKSNYTNWLLTKILAAYFFHVLM